MLLTNFIPMLHANQSITTAVTDTTKRVPQNTQYRFKIQYLFNTRYLFDSVKHLLSRQSLSLFCLYFLILVQFDLILSVYFNPLFLSRFSA